MVNVFLWLTLFRGKSTTPRLCRSRCHISRILYNIPVQLSKGQTKVKDWFNICHSDPWQTDNVPSSHSIFIDNEWNQLGEGPAGNGLLCYILIDGANNHKPTKCTVNIRYSLQSFILLQFRGGVASLWLWIFLVLLPTVTSLWMTWIKDLRLRLVLTSFISHTVHVSRRKTRGEQSEGGSTWLVREVYCHK